MALDAAAGMALDAAAGMALDVAAGMALDVAAGMALDAAAGMALGVSAAERQVDNFESASPPRWWLYFTSVCIRYRAKHGSAANTYRNKTRPLKIQT